jgi:hypothetical protein
VRTAPAGDGRALCLHNVTGQPQVVAVDGEAWPGGERLRDAITGRRLVCGRSQGLRLEPYQALWLVVDGAETQ